MTEMEIGGSGGRLPDDEDVSRDGQTSGCGAQASGRQLSGDVSDVKSVNGAGPRRASEGEQRRMVDITRDKPIKVTVRVVVPVRDHPKFNFVGKLLGPKGNSLKRLQEDTMTKMAILGRGSMRDKHKEEELRCSGDPKFSHLNDDLHVEITAFAPPAEAHARIAYALAEVRRFLVPDYNDEIRQEQMWEMQILNTAQRRPLLSGGGGGDCTGGSPASSESTGSLSPATPPPGQHSPPPPLVHPALRGLEPGVARGSAIVAVVPAPTTVAAPASATVAASVAAAAVSSAGAGGATPPLVGRKRPLLPGGARPSMSPTKRTVLSILARARAAQGKDLPEYLHSTNGRSSGIPVLREDAIPGGSLV